MRHMTAANGPRVQEVQRQLAADLVDWCEKNNVTQRELSNRLNLSGGTANQNIRNWKSMSVSFVIIVADTLPGFSEYKAKWIRALAEDLGVSGEGILDESTSETIERNKKIRSAILEIQGLLVNLMNQL